MPDTAPQQTQQAAPSRARDVMTTDVVSVPPDMPVRQIAQLLLDHRISAVPVVDSDGVPVGMVSEGDLLGRDSNARLSRSEWWLQFVSGRLALDQAPRPDRTAGDVMSAPLVTVSEDTDIAEVARLLAIHRIKRVPVVRDGRLVGIVSRANLLHVVAAARPDVAATDTKRHAGLLASLFGNYRLPAWETVVGNRPRQPAQGRDDTSLAAADLRQLTEDFHSGETEHAEETRRVAARRRCERARDLIDAHVFDEAWRQVMHEARKAAEHGATELMLLRFPSQLCIDGGRAINTAQHSWPSTLRGRPAELYLRWERDLQPRGFLLAARVLEFPDGKPGDIGLFLQWAT